MFDFYLPNKVWINRNISTENFCVHIWGNVYTVACYTKLYVFSFLSKTFPIGRFVADYKN